MFEDYKKEVLAFYFQKKSTNLLSGNLENPKRLQLKNECLAVFQKKYSCKDDEMLQRFFDPSNKYNDHVKSIEKFELDKFRPLVNLLTKGTNIRVEEPVKLLAWLIDFDSYNDWKAKNKKPIDEKIGTNTPDKPGGETRQRPVFRIIFIFTITLLLISGVLLFWQYGHKNGIGRPLADEKCMYWTGDHYEPVKCDAKIENAVIKPIDIRAVNNLRRINLADTLTRSALGKVWYSKVNGKHVFFTDSGLNPMDNTKRLKPLTKYILANHISYDRFLLSVVRWSTCGILLVALLSTGIFWLSRKYNKNLL